MVQCSTATGRTKSNWKRSRTYFGFFKKWGVPWPLSLPQPSLLGKSLLIRARSVLNFLGCALRGWARGGNKRQQTLARFKFQDFPGLDDGVARKKVGERRQEDKTQENMMMTDDG